MLLNIREMQNSFTRGRTDLSWLPVKAVLFAFMLLTVSFAALANAAIDLSKLPSKQIPLADVRFISASDGQYLAYRQYVPRNAEASAIVLHGVGFHSGIGLQYLAYPLASKHRIAVYTPDLRGHGRSAGDGLSPIKTTTLWIDLDTIIEFVRSQNKSRPLIIVAHSSAARLLLNYINWREKPLRADGIVFIAPDLGDEAALYRSKDGSYFESELLGSLTSKLTFGLACKTCTAGVVKHSNETTFSFPGLLTNYNNAFAGALALKKPYMAVRRLRLPFEVIGASKDEYVQGGKTKMFFSQNGRKPWLIGNELVRNESHFSILGSADELIAAFVEGLGKP